MCLGSAPSMSPDAFDNAGSSPSLSGGGFPSQSQGLISPYSTTNLSGLEKPAMCACDSSDDNPYRMS